MDTYHNIKKIIYGDILSADNINSSLKKWRKIFNISQVELAKKMGITSSVISEYESDYNRMPGTRFIKRYVEALIELDMLRGGKIIKLLSGGEERAVEDGILSIFDNIEMIPVKEYIEATDSEVVSGEERIDKTYIYGHTIIDGVTAILSMSGEAFYKIYGKTTERVLIFTNVSIGRSPLVAVRVCPLKPRAVILHGPPKIDELGVKIAEKENLILGLSKIPSINKLIKAVENLVEKYKNYL